MGYLWKFGKKIVRKSGKIEIFEKHNFLLILNTMKVFQTQLFN